MEIALFIVMLLVYWLAYLVNLWNKKATIEKLIQSFASFTIDNISHNTDTDMVVCGDGTGTRLSNDPGIYKLHILTVQEYLVACGQYFFWCSLGYSFFSSVS